MTKYIKLKPAHGDYCERFTVEGEYAYGVRNFEGGPWSRPIVRQRVLSLVCLQECARKAAKQGQLC